MQGLAPDQHERWVFQVRLLLLGPPSEEQEKRYQISYPWPMVYPMTLGPSVLMPFMSSSSRGVAYGTSEAFCCAHDVS